MSKGTSQRLCVAAAQGRLEEHLVAEAAELLSGGGEPAELAVLVHRCADPVHARVLQSGGRRNEA